MDFWNIATLAGGLGLFLYGMKMMSDGLERAAGNRLRNMLNVLTTNRFLGMLVGMVFTMLIQSSSATTVMTVGFVNAGLMNLFQATGVILGANIGTTITGQIIAFKLTALAPVAIFAGVAIVMFTKKNFTRHIGEVIAGFGILFIGLDMMSTSMEPLKDVPEFVNMLVAFKNPVLGILAGIAFTAIIQSSSASVGILQALAMQGLIDLDAAYLIILGQNIGTCVTAMLASVGTSKTAHRAAIIHLMFNVFSSVIVFALIQCFPAIIDGIQALSPGDVSRQIANAHTLFNVLGVIIFLPMSNLLVKLSMKIVPGEDPQMEERRLKYLDDRILTTPALVVPQILKEVNRMADLAVDNINRAMDAFLHKNAEQVNYVQQHEQVINYLNHEITHYLVKANQLDLPEADMKLNGILFHTINDLERIGDHAENLTEYATSRIEGDIKISDAALDELETMNNHVQELLRIALRIFNDHDTTLTSQVAHIEEIIDEEEDELKERHIQRLNKSLCTPQSGMLFMDVITNLERVADHGTNIAYSVGDMQA